MADDELGASGADDDVIDVEEVDGPVDEADIEEVDMREVFAGLPTDPLPDGATVQAAFALVKGVEDDGSIAWEGRSGGVPVSTEELLGALEGLVRSLRNDLASDWEG